MFYLEVIFFFIPLQSLSKIRASTHFSSCLFGTKVSANQMQSDESLLSIAMLKYNLIS